MNSTKNILKVNHEKYLDMHLNIFSSQRSQLDLNLEQSVRNLEETFNPENKSNLIFNINKYLEKFNQVKAFTNTLLDLLSYIFFINSLLGLGKGISR
jgi:hypothetical protein